MTEKIRLIIVEDDAQRADDLKKRVVMLGYDVCALCATGAEAGEYINDNPPDIAILDTSLKSGISDAKTTATLFHQHSIPAIYICTDHQIVTDHEFPDPCGYMIPPVHDNELRIALEFAVYKQNMDSQVAQIRAQLQKNDQELESFVHMASHDLRSPLQSIATYTGILQDYVEAHEPDEEIIQFMERIFSNIRVMGNLISDFVHISRLSRRKNFYEQVDPATLIKSALDRLNADIKNSKTKVHLPKSLQPIMCDRLKFAELFYNIISNAVKFSSKRDTGHPEITISYTSNDHGHTFCIADNGIGIDEKYHDKIFNPFIKLHSKDDYPGSGLGLYLVKNIIDGHHGSVWFESQKYNGTSFFVSIPNLTKTAASAPKS